MGKAPASPRKPPPKRGRPSPPEARARAAELRAQGKDLTEIGRILGRDRKTVREWLRTPEARTEVAQISADTRREALQEIHGAQLQAVRLLLSAVQAEDAPWSDRIAAAKTLLSRGGLVEGAALQFQAEALDPLAMAARLLQTAGEAPSGGG